MIPISTGDVARALVLINRILNAHFEQDLRADTQYGQLLRDVKFFRRVLERYQVECLSVTNAPYRPGQNQESQDLVGDFNHTLEECERLLSRYSAIGRTAPNIAQNAAWDFHVSPKIQRMNVRIKAHILKLNLLRDQMRTERSNDMDVTVGRLEDRVINLHRHIHPQSFRETLVPEYLTTRFLRGLYLNAPPHVDPQSMAYFQQAFDALVRHFELAQGHGPTCTLDQHISLYKARWLCTLLRTHPRFRETLHYRNAISTLDEKIEHELSGSDPDIYLEQDIQSADDKLFLIWEDDGEEEDGDSDHDGERSERVLDVILADGVTRLTVSRHGAKDFTVRTQNPRRPDRNANISFRIDSIQLEPTYTLSSTKNAPTKMTILHHTTSDVWKVLDFRLAKDAFKLQQIFTDFQVVSDFPSMHWWYSASKPETRCARLQIWLYKKAKALPPFEPPPTVHQTPPASPTGRLNLLRRTSTNNSRISQSASSVLSTQSLDEQVAAVFHHKVASTDGKKGIVTLREPTPPAIVLFTCIHRNGRDRRTILRLPLEYGIRIDLTACDCKDQTSCLHVVLSNKNNNKLNPVIIQEDDHDRNWNVILPGALRCEQTFRKIARLEQCQYFSFRFQDLNDKRKFLKDFDTVNMLRMRDSNLYEDARTMSGWMGDHPRAKTLPTEHTLVGRTMSSASSIQSPSSSDSSTIRLPRVSLGENFAELPAVH